MLIKRRKLWFCSMFSLLFLHFFLYGCNIFIWRKARINYSFIFELAPTKELKYREVFLICAASMTAVVGVLSVHLLLVAKGYTSTQVQTLPGILVLVLHILQQIRVLHSYLSHKTLNWLFSIPKLCLPCSFSCYFLFALSTLHTSQAGTGSFVH